MWAALAAVITVRTVHRGLPFSLTWWSFTFPLGTCVTGLNGLAAYTHLAVFEGMAVGGYTLLLGAWAVVATRTFHGSVVKGVLFQAPMGPAPAVSAGAAPVGASPSTVSRAAAA
jgi:tellurite resistance protein TehA-like permease